jgi:hypothetical protein
MTVAGAVWRRARWEGGAGGEELRGPALPGSSWKPLHVGGFGQFPNEIFPQELALGRSGGCGDREGDAQ